MAGPAVFASCLCSRFGKDPRAADNPTDTERNILKATEKPTAVIESPHGSSEAKIGRSSQMLRGAFKLPLQTFEKPENECGNIS
jgi:hypothetical protein